MKSKNKPTEITTGGKGQIFKDRKKIRELLKKQTA